MRETVHSQYWKVGFLNRIPPEADAKIFESWVQGLSRDETARISMASEGTVSAKWASLPRCFEPLRDLAKALRKLNLTPLDALKGVELLQVLTEHGMRPEQIRISLEAIRKASTEERYQPKSVIEASIKLANLENRSGMEYPEALKRFETVTQKISELEQENSQLQIEIEENRLVRNDTLEKAETAPQELSEFSDCKAALRRYGININDAETLRKLVDNFQEAGGNAKHLVSLVKKHGSIAKLVAYLERQLPMRQDELADLLSHIRDYRKIVFQLQEKQKELESDINSQKNAINYNNYQLYLIRANIAELERRRQALITWIGKRLQLPQEEIENLRLNSQYEIVLAFVDNALKDYARSLYGA